MLLTWFLLLFGLIFILGFALAESAKEVRAIATGGTPITPTAPWLEVQGDIVSGQPVSYTFSATAGQVVAIDGIMPITSTMEGRVSLYPLSTGITFEDEIYGRTWEDFNLANTGFSDNLVHITAALPETGDYAVEIAPDAGETYSEPFSFKITLVDPASSITVDEDLAQCPGAPTGSVRAAVRAVNPGGTVSVCEGTYPSEEIIIFGYPDVTLQGAGAELTHISGRNYFTLQIGLTDAASPLTSTGITVRDLSLDNRQTAGSAVRLYYDSHGFTLQDCLILTAEEDGIVLNQAPQGLQSSPVGQPHDDITVQNCEFRMKVTSPTSVQPIYINGNRATITGNSFNNLEDHYAHVGVNIVGDDAVVRDNLFGTGTDIRSNIGIAVLVTGDRAVVEDNDILSYTTGVEVRRNGNVDAESAVIRNNLFGDNTGASPRAIYIRNVKDALIESNFVRGYPHLAYGVILNSTGGRMVNNRITTLAQIGVNLSWSGVSADDVYPFTFANNNVHRTSAAHTSLWANFGAITTTVPVTVVNNIFTAPPSAYDSHCGLNSSAPLQMADYNFYDGFGSTYCDEAVPGAHDLYGDPEFADAEFHLKISSRAIDRGTGSGAPGTDFEGEARPANLGVDIGADERSVPTDLSVIKDGPAYGFTGVDMRYEIVVSNYGPATATGVYLEDIFPPAANPVDISTTQGSCSGTGPITCTLGTIDPGNSVELSVDLNISQAGILTNTVMISGNEIDNNTENNEDVYLTDVAEPPAGPFDVFPVAMEVTQGIQNMDNFVILVADKPTALRLYLESDGETIPNMMAVLHGSRNGQPLPGSPISPIPGYEAGVASLEGSSRTDLAETTVFLLPEEWRYGNVTLTAEVNPLFTFLETNEKNNTLEMDISYFELPVICIKTYPLRTFDKKGNDNLALDWRYLSKDSDGMIPRALSQLPAPDIWVYPVEKLLEDRTPFEKGGPKAYDVEKRKNGIIGRLWKLDQLSFDPADCTFSGARTHYMAMVHSETDWNRGGWADGLIAEDHLIVKFDTGGASFEQPAGGVTLAHELGHNYNRWHVPCGDTEGNGLTNWRYPYDYCMFTPDTSEDGFFGLDIITSPGRDEPIELIVPRRPSGNPDNDLGDLMSYAGQTWISDFNWRRIAYRLCIGRYGPTFCLPWYASPDIPESPGDRLQATDAPITTTFPYSGDILLLSGWITDSVSLSSVDRLPKELMHEPKLDYLWQQQHELTIGGSPYELQLLDVNDTILYTQTFTAGVVFDGGGDAFFGLVAPFITDTTKIRVTVNGVAAITRTASAHAPTVTVLSPNGGEAITETMTINWVAEDLDGDPLQFTVQYSADDGATWQVLDNEVYTNTLVISTTLLPGSDGYSLLRVIANDGFLTGIDQSDAAFSLSSHAPQVWINDPITGTLFDTGQVIHLRGQALDPEDGHLDGSSLTWSVEGIGQVGEGREATIFGLPAGTHLITLTAADDDGQTNTTSVIITVIPNGQQVPSETNTFLPLLIR